MQVRVVPYSWNSPNYGENCHVVIIALSSKQSLSLVWCEPQRVPKLGHITDENRVYDALARGCRGHSVRILFRKKCDIQYPVLLMGPGISEPIEMLVSDQI